MKKKILFHLTKRGLCSELLTLIYTIAYSKINNIDIEVEDKFWNSYYKLGWRDYFKINEHFNFNLNNKIYYKEPYQIKNFSDVQLFLNYTYVLFSLKNTNEIVPKAGLTKYLRPLKKFIKDRTKKEDWQQTDLYGGMFTGHKISSNDLWKDIVNLPEKEQTVNLDGKMILLSSLLSELASSVWQIEESVSSPELLKPNDYISLHIRRGDKLIKEAEKVAVDIFIDFIEDRNWDKKNIFISSDDYLVIEELIKKRPHWKILSLAKENQKGHDQATFNKRSKEDIYDDTKSFIREINIHINSEVYVGSVTSNVTKLISLIRSNKERTYSVDSINSDIFSKFYRPINE